MVHSFAASVCHIARACAHQVPSLFSTDNDVVTRDWRTAHSKPSDLGGLFHLVTISPETGEGDNVWWPQDVTLHGDKIFKAVRLFLPKDMS